MAYNMKRGNKKVSFKELRTLPGIQKSPLEMNNGKDDKDQNPTNHFLEKKLNPTTKAVHKKVDIANEKESDEETKRINRPPATRPPMFSDADAHRKTQSNLNKKKHPLGIEDPAELEKLYKTTENPNNKGRQ